MHARSEVATLATMLALLIGSGTTGATAYSSHRTGATQQQAAGTLPRFARDPQPIALTGSARPGQYMEASGRRAAFLGREDGSFEAWVYPLKVLHDFELSFGVAAYTAPIPGADLATEVDVRPEAATVRFAHAAFTADATWFVPLEQAGGLVLLDIDTSEPLTVTVRFRPDLKLMWPAGLGGQYSYWDDSLHAYVLGEGSGTHAALVGSPLGLQPPPQPAHNLPDAPTQFSMKITPATAASGLVPIVIAASDEGLEDARATYEHLLSSTAQLYHESAAHYRTLHQEYTSIEAPDERIGLALEWGKVALDKGFVCNPQLGCGLIAGLGPSGSTERPGFGWFFGGDAFINAWAITAYGDFDTVKRSLEFLRQRQRADGKMMHELSQAAAYIRWFQDYPYGYYHADTTPLYIQAVRNVVRASGDVQFARKMWPSVRAAYEYCLSTDEDGDGLMDNSRAGLAAVETGTLRSAEVLTDVFLGAAWTDAAAATAELAALAGEPARARQAQQAYRRARASLNRRFGDDDQRRIYFALLRDGRRQAAPTVWPAFGLWRGVFDSDRPAVAGALDQLAGSGIGADWGARMLSRRSPLYEPLSYNNGAVWPFLSGYALLALYAQHRPFAAYPYLEATAELTFLGARGYVPELLSGDRLRPIDAAVPHQLFATTGFVAGALRGLVGIGAEPIGRAETTPSGGTSARSPGPRGSSPNALVLAPQIPPAWSWLGVRNLHWHGTVLDLQLHRQRAAGVSAPASNPAPAIDQLTVRLTPRGATEPVPVILELTLPPGAEPIDLASFIEARPDTRGGVQLHLQHRVAPEGTTLTVRYRPGVQLWPEHEPLSTGDRSMRLRVIDVRLEGHMYTARLQGRRGHTYRLHLDLPFELHAVRGARQIASEGRLRTLELSVPDGEGDWAEVEVALRLGPRTDA